MMEMPVHQIVHVIAVRNRDVSTPIAMLVCRVMSTAAMLRRAIGRIRRRHVDAMFFDRRAVLMVQVPVVEIVHVPIVHDGGVATTQAVHV